MDVCGMPRAQKKSLFLGIFFLQHSEGIQDQWSKIQLKIYGKAIKRENPTAGVAGFS